MKVHIEHVFYLDFMLPEPPPGEGLRFDIQVSVEAEYRAIVVGWNRTSELFVGELGQGLANSELTIRPAWRTEGQMTARVRDNVVDHLIVLIELEVETVPPEDSDLAYLWLNRAVSCANYILAHLRTVTRVPRIRPIRRYWKPGHARFAVEVPYTICWRSHPDGSFIPMFEGFNSLTSTGAVEAPHTGQIDLPSLSTSLSTGMPPLLPLSLLVDAEEALTGLRLREAILSIGSACEITATTYVNSQARISKSQLRNVGNGKPFAERYLHEIPDVICGRSLRREDLPTFRQFELLRPT